MCICCATHRRTLVVYTSGYVGGEAAGLSWCSACVRENVRVMEPGPAVGGAWGVRNVTPVDGYRWSRERTDCEAALACDRANEPACDSTWIREKFPASEAKSTSRMPDSAALTLVCVTDRLASVDDS